MKKFSILMKKLGIQRALRWPVGIEQILPVFFQKPAKHLHKTSSYYFFLVGSNVLMYLPNIITKHYHTKNKTYPKHHHSKIKTSFQNIITQIQTIPSKKIGRLVGLKCS